MKEWSSDMTTVVIKVNLFPKICISTLEAKVMNRTYNQNRDKIAINQIFGL